MNRISCTAVLWILTLAPSAQGAAQPASSGIEQPLDTVLVEGTQARLNEILQEMVKSEDRFFARYNELNTKDDFDMMCFREARVGTNMKRRYCIANYMNLAMRQQGQDYAWLLQGNSQGSGSPTYSSNTGGALQGMPPTPPIIMIEARRKDLKQNMRDVVTRNPELVEMLKERYELGKRYEATRRALWGLKPPAEQKDTAPSATGAPVGH